MNMSEHTLSSPPPNGSSLSTASYEQTDRPEMEKQIRYRLVLFGLCVTIAAATLAGGVYSLLSLLRMRRKTSLCLIVVSMSVDDILGVVPLSIFALLQWEGGEGDGEEEEERVSESLCTLSGLLYVFLGVSCNMKSCLIAAYTFYVTKRFGGRGGRPRNVLWAIGAVWAVSLTVGVLPLCGWGTFTPASLGCFPKSDSFYIVLLFALYSLCVCGLLFFFVPLTHQLLCSRESQKTLFPSHLEMAAARGLSGSAAVTGKLVPKHARPHFFRGPLAPSGSSCTLCDVPSRSPDSLNKTCCCSYNELSPSSLGTGREPTRDKVNTCQTLASDKGLVDTAAIGDIPVAFAQKRFSMILAVLRVVLWMPMMTSVLVRLAVNARSSTIEMLSFFLTLLGPAATPLFVLSERWIHMPCGCFINCKRDPTQERSELKRRIEFTLSFQQGYGVYKLSHVTKSPQSPSAEKPSYRLFNCDFSDSRLHALDSGGLSSLQADIEFSTTHPVDSSSHIDLLEAVAGGGEALADCDPLSHESIHGEDDDAGFHCVPLLPSFSGHPCDQDHDINDASSVFEGPERRLSHEEGRKIELTDWEWCRSKSERTTRQFERK